MMQKNFSACKNTHTSIAKQYTKSHLFHLICDCKTGDNNDQMDDLKKPGNPRANTDYGHNFRFNYYLLVVVFKPVVQQRLQIISSFITKARQLSVFSGLMHFCGNNNFPKVSLTLEMALSSSVRLNEIVERPKVMSFTSTESVKSGRKFLLPHNLFKMKWLTIDKLQKSISLTVGPPDINISKKPSTCINDHIEKLSFKELIQVMLNDEVEISQKNWRKRILFQNKKHPPQFLAVCLADSKDPP
ncbi:hypothetical protein EGR_08666 [Echinococcus granulosus]|uniref:Uncharacterized protein n=1 Tax=Echinococcus granulosus TaxID=6210 RepID=W6USX7_ECHGR|nr:hypothetical protein EGR_08666 [Echinococcus granulosus]EUB56489.1 hypothetical protein EGR_08666 [Echinococcus granulosus]